MGIKESFQKLSEVSDMAKQMLEQTSTRIVLLRSNYGTYTNEFSFHPNGKGGCINLENEYMFGIRCDHLMWSEGEVEGVEDFMEGIENTNVILIFGNHKGSFCEELLTFSEKEGERSCFIP